MSTYTSEPGTRLAGRYRLVDQMTSGTGWTYWKATDETLARSVTVLTFAPGFPRIGETATAARAASRLSDPRFAQVFDVEDQDEIPYVVMEWVRGETLIDMLTEGPLDPRRAATLVGEAAQAMAFAHRSGQAHLRLDPACVHWTPGGGVKIAGLGINAALAGPELVGDAEDPDLTDTRDLGRLLYAALTGYWPGPAIGTLPQAPVESDGVPCTPRQVAAGVPASLDSVTCRALFQQENRQGPALSTTADFADALTSVTPPPPPPTTAGYAPGFQTTIQGFQGSTNPYPEVQAAEGYRRRHPANERSAAARAIVSLVIVLVLAAVGVAAWAISRGLHHTTAAQASHQPQSSKPSTATAVQLNPVSAIAFNPVGSTDDPSDAPYALGTTAGKYWHTEYYDGYANFGNLKKGTGLLINMGTKVELSQVVITFGTSCCTTASIEIGDSSSGSLSSFTPVATSAKAAGPTTFPVSSKASGQYVLIWITSLPPLSGQPGEYQAEIYRVTLRGNST
jgi:serine/threonine protein kinase